MSKNKHLWDTKENAEQYDLYSKNFFMYKNTSKDLIDLAKIEKNTTIIDLASGTGNTIQEIINKVGDEATIVAVDQSSEMLEKAREKFGNKVKYIISEAESFSEKINFKVDFVISNSAFWQMDAEKVFDNVFRVLKTKGMFAFNLPDQFFDHPDFSDNTKTPATKYSREGLLNLAKKKGFRLYKEVVKSYEKSLDEIIAFQNIPVMKANFKSEEDRLKSIEKLKNIPEDKKKNQEWVYFVFTKIKPDVSTR